MLRNLVLLLSAPGRHALNGLDNLAADMSLTFKLASLVIRTVAKPIGNYIKRSAREHDQFRRYCVGFAQGLHRVDMRMRLGILHDAAAQERMHAREAAEAAAKKRQAETPTVKTEAQQKADDAATAEAKKEGAEEKAKVAPKPKIRPLSEARAIDLGANFLAESFIFAVAAGLLVWDQIRARRKENTRREGIDDRLESLEEHTRQIIYLRSEIDRLKSKYEPTTDVETSNSDQEKDVQSPKADLKDDASKEKPALVEQTQ